MTEDLHIQLKQFKRVAASEEGCMKMRHWPLKDHKIAMEVIMMTSLPSNHNASQSRSCCEKGTVFTNKVMYHFVPHADDDIMFRCCKGVSLATSVQWVEKLRDTLSKAGVRRVTGCEKEGEAELTKAWYRSGMSHSINLSWTWNASSKPGNPGPKISCIPYESWSLISKAKTRCSHQLW